MSSMYRGRAPPVMADDTSPPALEMELEAITDSCIMTCLKLFISVS